MILPIELIHIIYYFSNIDTQLNFRKLFPYHTFIVKKLTPNVSLSQNLSKLMIIHLNKYKHLKSLRINLQQHNLLQHIINN